MDKIAIGKVRTSVGVQGYLKLLSFSGEIAHFKKLIGQSVEIRHKGRKKNLTVEDVKMSGASPIMKVAGIDSPEEAKKLSGWELYVEREKAAALGEDEYYLLDLCKCSLVMDGKPLGEIKSVLNNGVTDLLEVQLEDRIIMVPFTERFVGDVDLDSGTVELTEAWLLE
jgi:16S rRNA processing protein RimM